MFSFHFISNFEFVVQNIKCTIFCFQDQRAVGQKVRERD